MNKSRLGLICIAFIPIMLVLTTSGCATKGFVKAQVATTDVKISALEAKTNEHATKEQADISRVEEKIATTDSRVAEVATAAQQANASATQAHELAQQNQAGVAANTTAIATLHKAMNYSLTAKGDVTFGFDKSNLGKTDEAALDTLIQQVQSEPRAVFEVLGFTDSTGSKAYNLALSRRRADSVARYLVHKGVSLRGINIIGLGEEPLSASVLAELQAVDPDANAADSRRLARRVLIRIYTAEASIATSASLKQ
jgi:outer membrane protein OmpA-like peptidoglycan-associated protein